MSHRTREHEQRDKTTAISQHPIETDARVDMHTRIFGIFDLGPIPDQAASPERSRGHASRLAPTDQHDEWRPTIGRITCG